MKILIVAATSLELEPLKESIGQKIREHQIHYYEAGVGMVSTAYRLTKKLCSNRYDLAVNVGIAGSFKQQYPIGSVLEVRSDRFSELGAEDGDGFLDLVQMKLQEQDDFPFKASQLIGDAPLSTVLPKVSGITVNKVHGNEISINKVMGRFNPDVESMEGAAFMYVCRMEKVPCIQIRAISNFIERRDTSKWQFAEPLQNLANEVKKYLKSYE